MYIDNVHPKKIKKSLSIEIIETIKPQLFEVKLAKIPSRIKDFAWSTIKGRLALAYGNYVTCTLNFALKYHFSTLNTKTWV